MQRNRAMRELAPLVGGAGPFKDDEIQVRFKAFDEANQRALQEIRQAELELDGVLAPWQRVRFRMLEERLERQKIEMLVKLRGARDAGPAADRHDDRAAGWAPRRPVPAILTSATTPRLATSND